MSFARHDGTRASYERRSAEQRAGELAGEPLLHGQWFVAARTIAP